jgi:transcriptional regulator with PAS, ATPase and Fis domain
MKGVAEHQALWVKIYGGRPLSADDVLLGRSPSIQRLQQTIDRLGPTDVCVLIQGESGVGKERVASALHKAGHGRAFIALNCAAIPKDLLEAELFGVEKGAFTGAVKARPGLVEQANGGTLFLDEIGEMEIGVQPKLLRFLETRKARRVGGDAEYRVQVRVVSATNRNLDAEITENRFRADLYYRLAEIILQVPPLRARPEDLPELAMAFLKKANERFGKNFETLEPGLIARFQDYQWPGNVRELKSTVDRMVLLFDGPILRASWWDAPENRTIAVETRINADPGGAPDSEVGPPVRGNAAGVATGGHLPNSRQKLALAKQLLAESGDNYTWVAGQLGINSSTLWRWRKAGKLN